MTTCIGEPAKTDEHAVHDAHDDTVPNSGRIMTTISDGVCFSAGYFDVALELLGAGMIFYNHARSQPPSRHTQRFLGPEYGIGVGREGRWSIGLNEALGCSSPMRSKCLLHCSARRNGSVRRDSQGSWRKANVPPLHNERPAQTGGLRHRTSTPSVGRGCVADHCRDAPLGAAGKDY